MVRLELARAADFGVTDQTFIANCHIGEFVNYNDTVLGYDLNQQMHAELDEYQNNPSHKHELPDVVIVRKTFPRLRKRQKQRIWKLKQLHKQEVDENDVWKSRRDNKRSNKLHPKEDQDMEIFMQDIEEDPEIRKNVDLFRDDDVIERLNAKMAKLDLAGKEDDND